MHASTRLAAPAFAPPRRPALPRLPMRFLAIWLALGVLIAICAIGLPRSVAPTTIQTVLPFVAFLAIAAMGQALVLMGRGIDLSVPGIVSLASAVLLGVSNGSDDRLWLAILAALAAAVCVGLVNGLLVAVLRLNALIVTLATGAIVGGITLWYRQGLAAEAKVPETLATFAGQRAFGLPISVWFALGLAVLLTVGLRKTVAGRRFEAVGANPRAAHASGIRTMRYQAAAFVLASLLYGVLAILLSGFIRNPTLEVGNPYLLAPIAAAVLGGTAISGGIGSMIAVLGASLFVMQLDQASKMMGLATSWQLIVQGAAIAAGMWLSEAASRSGRR
ncbi:ABC transporter permease [Prosthecomicrobium pneumaticum]|uniref:Ribose transport system permease protein n=1 Tax=Prosthecomicrobium pneumaticum TaxID=81895 RepID=A0A7W9CSZ2_9HYPH|nr:ABC transporter permease [Prosthecomicrobium pneumaticum]MBB5751325.1 ribose transport system permease protein [Prosthecomicrobium pneumaticum]